MAGGGRKRGGGPVVGITTDLSEAEGVARAVCTTFYAAMVARAGGVPVLLPPMVEVVSGHIAVCDAIVLTGGDDPRTEPFGKPTHAAAKPVHAARQAYETALLRALGEESPEKPVLGICLGMQMMALCAGGVLNQHLPDNWATHASHRSSTHRVVGCGGDGLAEGLRLPDGEVMSNHRQAVEDAGGLVVVARAEDGLIEGVGDPSRRFYLGVQWHPERTADEGLGLGLFERLVAAAAR